MRIALALAGLAAFGGLAALAPTMVVATAAGDPSRGLSPEQIRGVMRAHSGELTSCLSAATRHKRHLDGPFLYRIAVDRHGKVTSVRPYQPSGVATFDRCITGVLLRARFPGGPANVETPLVFDAS
ncbi:MAG TPA: hypothetical protein VGD37_38350 [Kofleriaceae bacterium]